MIALLFLLLSGGHAEAGRRVEIKENSLVVDGRAEPQQFGAELQYFRLRGGYGPNVPREKVLALWNKALDRMVEAKMNSVSFYIPWDFHEYAEGKFDFDGTADEDGDGQADYPSRDLRTFFRLIEEHGIRRIMVRPGPFINAEWGFLGFGAIPQWFHEKYPQSHMRTPWGWNRALYDYLDPDFLRLTKVWFATLYERVLHEYIGEGKPVVFLQLDNETNYQWTSIYNADYAPRTVDRYRAHLRDTYRDLGSVNRAHARFWRSWSEVRPPEVAGRNLGEDQDWYRYSDQVIYRYLKILRGYWEEIGVKEPAVLFTLAESYNVTSAQGLLPNYRLRNAPGETGLMTVNLYPKVANLHDNVLFNSPFKADLDVKSADEANDGYLGSRQEWVMGPEVQGGWWRGTEVSTAARLQTYLTVLGHGMKSLFVYYFNEGQNWGTEWGYAQVKPLFDELRTERKLEGVPIRELPNDFWGELQARSDRLNVVGIDSRRLMQSGTRESETLFFDAPLDAEAEPRDHFYQLKQIGERVIAPYQKFLARSLESHDEVAFVRDSASPEPTHLPGLAPAILQSDGAGGLLGYLMNAGVNPRVLQGETSSAQDFTLSRLLVHLDTGVNAPETIHAIRGALAAGRGVLNFLGEDLPCQLGVTGLRVSCFLPTMKGSALQTGGILDFYLDEKGRLRPGPGADATKVSLRAPYAFSTYDLTGSNNCEGILFSQGKAVAYRCRTEGGSVVQVGAPLFADYNTDAYGRMTDDGNRRLFLRAILGEFNVRPKVQASGDRVVAFARHDPAKEGVWLTVKTGSRKAQRARVSFDRGFLEENMASGQGIRVKNLLRDEEIFLEENENSFPLELEGDGSAVFFLSR